MAKLILADKNRLLCRTDFRGFTIVELLVVIVVIGILAALTTISYSGVTNRANIAAIQSDLSNAVQRLKIYQSAHDSYPTALDSSYCPSAPVANTNLCLKTSANNTFVYTSDGATFGLTESGPNNLVYNVTSSTIIAAGSLTPNYTLTINASSNGTVNTEINGSYSSGSTPTITATPNSGYLFSNWTGSTGCNNISTASYAITVDEDKTCTANFAVDPWANWYSGIAATVLAGKHVYKTDLGATARYKTSQTVVTSPQGATGLDPNYPSNMSLVNPQTNPGVDFSAYPAQSACKAIGARLPNMQELLAIYTGRATYGNNFQSNVYWSSTDYNAFNGYGVNFSTGVATGNNKTGSIYIRCILD